MKEIPSLELLVNFRLSQFSPFEAYTAISKKVVVVNNRYWNRNGLRVQSLMSDNAPAQVVTVLPWRYDKPP